MPTIEDTLRECGVTATTLSHHEKERLDREGFLVFPGLVSDAWLDELRSGFDRAIDDSQGSRHSDELLVAGQAGTVLVFNGHLWHSGTRNRSRSRRRAIQCAFVATDAPWHVDVPEQIPGGLSEAARLLLEGFPA